MTMNTTTSYRTDDGTRGVEGATGYVPEGKIAKAIEKQTSKLPSDLFLWAAGIAIAGSLVLQSMSAFGRPVRFVGGRMLSRPRFANLSLFVGQWAPTFLLFGVYNKIVKVAGSERRA
jgi:hypothetical protein